MLYAESILFGSSPFIQKQNLYLACTMVLHAFCAQLQFVRNALVVVFEMRGVWQCCLFVHPCWLQEWTGGFFYGGAVLEFVSIPAGDIESNGKSGREGLSDCRLMDHKNGTELVLTYKDKDGDWMLVGDVPWRWVISLAQFFFSNTAQILIIY